MTPYYSVLPLFLFSCLNAEAFAQGIRALPTVNGTDANLSQIYNGAVSSKSLDMYLYSYREMTNQVIISASRPNSCKTRNSFLKR